MKKLLLVVALGVTGLVSANTIEEKLDFTMSKEVKLEKGNVQLMKSFSKLDKVAQLCQVTIYFYNYDGSVNTVLRPSADFETYEECRTFQFAIKLGLMNAGYAINDLW